MKFIYTFIAIMFMTVSAYADTSAKPAIEAFGFKDVQLSSSIVIGRCAETDSAVYNTYFTATALSGRKVEGVLCGASFKGWTVRILEVK